MRSRLFPTTSKESLHKGRRESVTATTNSEATKEGLRRENAADALEEPDGLLCFFLCVGGSGDVVTMEPNGNNVRHTVKLGTSPASQTKGNGKKDTHTHKKNGVRWGGGGAKCIQSANKRGREEGGGEAGKFATGQ